MAFLTSQRQNGGRHTSIYVTVARWGDLRGGRRGAIQQRLYVGRLASDGGHVRLSKGIAGSARVRVDLAELRRKVAETAAVADVQAWLRSLCAPVPGDPGIVPTTGPGTDLVGQVHVLGTLARALGLDRCLDAAFGDATGAALLHLAMHQVVRGEPLYLARLWLADLRLPELLARFDFSSPGLSRLMDATGRAETARQAFYRTWMSERRHPRALIYDLTSISTYAADLEAAAFGHNRDHEPLPQENLALVCDRSDGMPLFCRLVPGSVPDVVTLNLTARMLRTLGLNESEFVLDRGFYSGSNVRELLLKGHHFTMGVLLHCRQSKQLLARHRARLGSPKRSVFHEGRSIRHIRDDWAVDMGRDGRGTRRDGRIVAAHIFFDPRRHADGVAALDERVFALEHRASRESFTTPAEARRWLTENARYLASCLAAERTPDGMFAVRRRPRAVAARSANIGYQIIICDTVDRDGVAVLSDYRRRDRAEKLFDLFKNEDGQYRLRTGNQTVAEGRTFLAFLALALRTELENRMRAGDLLRKLTVPEFLAEMGRIRAITLPDGSRVLREVTRRQREWLAAIGVEPPRP